MLLADLADKRVELFRTCHRVDDGEHLVRRQPRLPRVRIARAVPHIFDRGE